MDSPDRIDSLDDPRIAAYRNLRDRTLRGERMFVAEGSLLVERLLASRFEAESLLATESLAAEFLPRLPGGACLCRRGRASATDHRL